MTPASLRLLRLLANRPGDVGEIVCVVLELEGEREQEASAEGAPKNTSTNRWRRWRDKQTSVGANATNALANASANAPQTLTNAPPTLANGSRAPALSLGISLNSPEPERESPSLSPSGNAREPTSQTRLQTVAANALANAPLANALERYVAPTDPPTPELIAVAQMVGVQDVNGAWLKFTGHYAGKWVHVAGAWQKWCATEAKHERTERERERQRGKDSAAPLTAEGLDPNSYEASQLRKKRAKAERDAEAAEVRARLEAQKASAQ